MELLENRATSVRPRDQFNVPRAAWIAAVARRALGPVTTTRHLLYGDETKLDFFRDGYRGERRRGVGRLRRA